ncbi:MAG TPA: hypothetical protein VKT77_14170 [Chthonomonadaceae bacterium]|nr:hypothetical protein [Chthonomonadaceae bacterium]
MPEPEPEIEAAPPVRSATVRLSQRELTIISCSVVALIVCVLGFLGFRAMLGFKASHDLLIAKQNMHALHKAFYSYAQDWDQRLPSAANWTDAVAGFLSSTGQAGGPLAALHGPGDGKEISYVYNDLAAGRSLDTSERKGVDLAHLVLLIERPGAEPNAHVSIPIQGNPDAEAALQKQLTFPHGSDDSDNAATLVLYADGHQDVLTPRYFRH